MLIATDHRRRQCRYMTGTFKNTYTKTQQRIQKQEALLISHVVFHEICDRKIQQRRDRHEEIETVPPARSAPICHGKEAIVESQGGGGKLVQYYQ